jgi:hypothetical protein
MPGGSSGSPSQMTPAPGGKARVDGLEERGYTLFAGPIGCWWQGESIFLSRAPVQSAQAWRVVLHEAHRLGSRTREYLGPGRCSVAT